MKRKMIVILIVMIMLSFSCRSTRIQPSRSIFVFDFEGQSYEIISTVIETNSGYNFLLQRENQQIVLRAIDNDQDGILDSLMVGNVTLEKANEIYMSGIQKANSKGGLKKQIHRRNDQITGYSVSYNLHTYHLLSRESYNKFDNRINKHIVLLDMNADGVLDKIEKDNNDLMKYQGHYEKVIALGISDGKINNKDNMYLVNPQ